MKVLYFATYYTKHYVRQDVIRWALNKNESIDLVECIYNSKSFFRYFKVFWKFINIPKKDIDVIIVGFRGNEILPLIRLFTKKPIIFDAFISMYDTLCFDRKVISPTSLMGKFVYKWDQYTCKKSEGILLDTNEYIKYFQDTFFIPKNKFCQIWVGFDQSVFISKYIHENSDNFTVLYYGTGLPLQGIPTILNAAKILEKNKKIIFKIIGPVRKKYSNLVRELYLSNVEFVDWLPYQDLAKIIGIANICLGGHFSDIEKGRRVVSGKTFQFLAMKKAVIVGNTKGNNELLKNYQDCLMVEVDNPKSLADGVLKLYNDKELRDKISFNGYNTVMSAQKDIVWSLGEFIKKIINGI